MSELSRLTTIEGGVEKRHFVGGGGICWSTSGGSGRMFVFRSDVESYK